MANVIKHKRGSGSDPGASDLILGELAIRTDTGKLFTKMDSGAIAEIAGGGSDIAINTLSSSSGTGGGSATFNGSAYRFTLSQPPNVSAAQLLVSINGVIQKPVAGTGQPSEGFSVDGTDIILGDAPATGSDFFILTFKSLGVSEPADNSVTSAKIVDGAIVNADINASAAIDVSKLSGVLPLAGGTLTGNLLINNTSPSITLVDSNNNPDYQIGNSNGTLRFRDTNAASNRMTITSSAVDINVNLDANFGLDVTGAITGTGDLTIDTNTLHVDSTNNRVGIGTTSPATILHISQTNPELRIQGTNGNGGVHKIFSAGINSESLQLTGASNLLFNADTQFFRSSDEGTEYMRIDSSGKVGIGISSPVGLLHLHQADSGTVDGLMITNTSTTNNGLTVGVNSTEQSFFWNGSNTDMLFATNNTERMRIDSSGRVGIGTTNPQNKLHLESSSNTYLRIVKTGNSSNVYLGNSGGEAILESTGGAIKLKPNGRSNDFVLNTSGFVGIGTTSPTDKLHVVGTTNLAGNSYLTNAYVSGNIYLGGTAAANALDDYEEGTYTPVIYYDSVNNHTYSEQVGTYTKIGNFCHGYIVITWDEVDSEGQVKFSLPFTSSNISGTRTSGYFIYQDGLNLPSGQGSTHLILYGGQNSSQIAAYFTGSTNNSELGTNPTKMTNTHTSSHNTTRMVFHYRTA
jgi:hypothetical protein